ncbi:MAG: hypothetical protein V9G18_13430 [Albidovulum sp.]
MASTPDCRVAASLSAPAGFSGFPVSPDPSPFLASDELLQRQLDELAAIRRRLRQLADGWPTATEASGPPRPAVGDFLLYPAVWRFRRGLAVLEGACGALAGTTQARLDRALPGLAQLRVLTWAGRAGGGS